VKHQSSLLEPIETQNPKQVDENLSQRLLVSASAKPRMKNMTQSKSKYLPKIKH
jgi:hypothetical protein